MHSFFYNVEPTSDAGDTHFISNTVEWVDSSIHRGVYVELLSCARHRD